MFLFSKKRAKVLIIFKTNNHFCKKLHPGPGGMAADAL